MLTDKCIKEYSYPVYNCDQNEDNCFVDYVELEIIPDVTGTAYSVICKYRNTSKGIHC